MSLDNIERIAVSSTTNMFKHLYEPQTVTTDRVDLKGSKESMSDSNLILMRDGARGWDMPSVTHKTRQTAEGHGELTTAYKLRGRRFSFRASELVSYISNTDDADNQELEEPETRNSNMSKLIKHLDPFTRSILCVVPAASGQYSRYLIGCQYLGGLDRPTRTGHGRSQFDVNLFSPWGYFVLNQIQAGLTFTPAGEGVCIWGVVLNRSAGIHDVSIDISDGDAPPWVWQWDPDQVGITPPETALGSGAPTKLIVCFSPPFLGVWGFRGALSDEVSAGRVSGAPQRPYLTPGISVTVDTTESPGTTSGTTGNAFYLRNYSSISY